jgi:acyl-CoA thioester hydrolase
MSIAVETRVRVRYAETDQMGVVYHANYIVWMEVGRVEYFRAKGVRYRDLEKDDDILLLVGEVNCRFKAPAFYDEEITISTRVAAANARMIHFEYELTAGHETDHRVVATGFSKHVFCGRDKRPVRLPEKYHAALEIGQN